MAENMTIHLKIWRQAGPETPGQLVAYTVAEANEHMSFLELLDVLNEQFDNHGELAVLVLLDLLTDRLAQEHP